MYFRNTVCTADPQSIVGQVLAFVVSRPTNLLSQFPNRQEWFEFLNSGAVAAAGCRVFPPATLHSSSCVRVSVCEEQQRMEVPKADVPKRPVSATPGKRASLEYLHRLAKGREGWQEKLDRERLAREQAELEACTFKVTFIGPLM